MFFPGTTSQLSRRCCLSSIRAPKTVSPRMANVYDGMRSPHNGGGTFENAYNEPTMRWRRSDGYFKAMSKHPVRTGQLSLPLHLDPKVESRRKGLRRLSLHFESWRKNSRAPPNNYHPYPLHPRCPGSAGNRPRNRPAHYGRDLLSFSAGRVRSRQLQTAQVTNTHRV